MLPGQVVRLAVCATALFSIGVTRDVCARAAADSSSAIQVTDLITQLAIERRCGGCAREVNIRVSASGAAVKTVIGNARTGTADRRFAGASTPAAFHEAAALADAAEFFDLHDQYRSDATADGETLATTVMAGARSKSVVDVNKAGPAALQRLESAMLAFDRSVTWKEIQ